MSMGTLKRKSITNKSLRRLIKKSRFFGGFFAVIIALGVISAWNITKAAPVVYDFAYTGGVQIFTAPEDGEYTFEAWGASGGYGHQNNSTRAGGKGAYTYGKTHLAKGDVVYVYVGGVGNNARSCGIYCGGAGGWNGGAKGGDDLNHDSQPDSAGGGGGATDFRLSTSLNSRVMVAGGGAGGSYSYLGRPGNALSGDGSSQVSGYSFGIGQAGIKRNSGSGGGGGGYWGGTSTQVDAGQGYGGSSFISGHPGAVAILSDISTAPRLASDETTVCTPALAAADTACSEHYSGMLFFESTVLSGAGVFLSPTGASATGHTGHGYARITGETYTDNMDKPEITSITPNTGEIAGGEKITIYGNNLAYIGTPTSGDTQQVARALIGGVECTDVTYENNTLTCITGANTSGLMDVFVFNGKRSVTATGSYEYLASQISSITPNIGPTAGEQEVNITGTSLATPPIPNNYTPLEYLNFTGTQYINTGVTQMDDPKIILDFQPNATGQVDYATIFGVYGTSANPYHGGAAFRINPGGAFGYVHNRWPDNVHTSGVTPSLESNSGERSLLEVVRSGEEVTLNLDGQISTTRQMIPAATYARNYFIGMPNSGGTANSGQAYRGKVFSMKMYKGDTIVRDFQPVRRSDNVLGMYDKVNGVFYANNGTGTFGAGPDLAANAYQGIVSIGGSLCANPTIADNIITCTTTQHSKGDVDVVVNNGIEIATLKNGYEYFIKVSTITPNKGPLQGGQEVTITGENLQTPTLGYTAVDYLNFTGTQYINTGVNHLGNPKVIVDFQSDPGTTQQLSATLFGARSVSATPYAGSSQVYVNSGIIRAMYNATGTNTLSSMFFGEYGSDRHVVEMGYLGSTVTAKLNGIVQTAEQIPPTIASNYFIGTTSIVNSPAANHYYKGKVFGAQLYKDGVLVRDFQPARRNSDNVLGMYDKLNKVFYTNSGSGTFGAGAVKPNAYLGVVQIGDLACADPIIISDNAITCTTSSSESGIFDVTVNNSVDTAALTTSYEYLADNFLRELSSSEGTISPSFDPEVSDYTLTLDADQSCPEITAIASDSSATILGDGVQCRQDGGAITVTVAALNGETRDYILNIVRPASDDATLADLQINGVTIDGFESSKQTYTLDMDDLTIRELEISYTKNHHYQTTEPAETFTVQVRPGATAVDVTVVSEDGSNTATYTIILTQPVSSRLMSLSSDSAFTEEFSPELMNYTMSIFSGVMSVSIDAVPYDDEAVVIITGAAYIPANGGMVTIRVVRAGVEDSIYTIAVNKQSDNIQTLFNYPYNGTVQMFVAPMSAEYFFEAWGASGGFGHRNLAKRAGGKGAYTSGKIHLDQGDTIYIYTGGVGNDAASCGRFCGGLGGWNGGAKGGDDSNKDAQPDSAGGGGGATDFRLSSNLNDRIMVAGAGAGGSYGYLGLPGNGLSGQGSSQISGHRFGIGQTGFTQTSGSGGGGGGYWGGLSNQAASGQGFGGSSFVSGHLGAISVISNSSTTPRVASDLSTSCTPELAASDPACSEHYSDYIFYDTTILSGAEQITSPAGAATTGHTGHGYARITMIIPPSDDNTLAELSFTNSTLSPEFSPIDPVDMQYTLSVPSTQPVINTHAVAGDPKATVIGHGAETILPADTPTEIIVTVISESGLVREYTTTATRSADSNSKIDMLTMGAIPTGLCKNNGEFGDYSCRFNDENNNSVFFNPNRLDYYVNIPTVSRKLNFDVVKGHLFQQVDASVDGKACIVNNDIPTMTSDIDCDNIPLGDSKLTITITSETGDQTVYTLHLHRTPGADIQNIELVHPPEEDTDILHFNPLATDYGVTGLPDTTEASFEVTVDSDVDVQVKFGESGDYQTCAIGVNGKPVCDVSGFIIKKNDIWIQASLNGMVKTYYINWYRQLNSNTLLSLLKVEDALNLAEEFPLTPSFNKTEENYTVYVPFTTTEVMITAEAERPDVSTVRGDIGIQSVHVGNNRFSIRTQAQDGSQSEYTVNVVRRADPNATIANIETSTPFTPAFDPENLNYIIELSPHQSAINFTKIEMQSEAASYRIIGNSGIQPGTTNVVVRGTAGDGTTRDYVFTVHMDPSNNNALASLSATCATWPGETLDTSVECQLSPDFDEAENDYSMTVPAEVRKITLHATLADSLSTISGLGTFELQTGMNEFDIVVTAQDDSQNITTITVERQQDTNNLLKTWTITGNTGGSINFDFNPTINDYNITVGNQVNRISVNATSLRQSAEVVLSARSPWNLDVGENNFNVTVMAENGDVNIYTMTITRQPSSDACLSRLSLQEARISPTFTCGTKEYAAEVPHRITEVTPIYTTTEPNATVAVTGANDLEVGENTVTLVVTAQDGQTSETFDIIVIRREDTSHSSRLVNMWTDIGEWDKNFDPDALYYEIKVTPTQNQIKVSGLIEDIDGPATTEGFGSHILNKGDNIIQIVVTATDGTTTTYTLNVIRALSDDASLKSLVPARTSLTPVFGSNTVLYRTTIDEEFIELTALPREASATVDGADENGLVRYPLNIGENTIDIRVVAEDGVTTKIYTVIVTRLVGTNAHLAELVVGENEVLKPTFKEITGAYTVRDMSADVNQIAIYAKTRDTAATLRIGSEAEVDYTHEATAQVQLEYGINYIPVTVTAANGINTMQYVITVIREVSRNSNLAMIKPSIGTLSPVFDPATTRYDINVDYQTTQMNIEAVVEHEGAIIVRAGNTNYSVAQNKKTTNSLVNLTDENTTFSIQIQSAFGGSETTNYTVVIHRNQNYPSTLDDLKLAPYSLAETFNPSSLNYTVEVDYEIDTVAKVPIVTTKTDPQATVEIDNRALNVGPNTVPITVTSRDGQSITTYNLTIIRRSYSNNFLQFLSTNQSTQIEPEFDKYNLTYHLTVSNTTSSLTLNAEPENYKSSVRVGATSFTGSGAAYAWPLNLNYGVNNFDITVTTLTNVKRVYKLIVTRELSSNTDLPGVNFGAGTQAITPCQASAVFDPETMGCAYTPVFDNAVNAYTIHVPQGTTKGEINIKAASSLATITGNGVKNLSAGQNEFTVTIQAQDGSSREITATFIREASDQNSIIDLKVVPGAEQGTRLEPEFTYAYDATTDAPYVVHVPGRIAMLGFDVQLEDSLYATVSGHENFPVPDGESIRQIIVTAENGDQRIYNILLIKTPLDTNNFLDYLEVDGEEVAGFAPQEKFYYDLGTVLHEKESIDITAFTTAPATILSGTGKIDLQSGDNNINIKVQAENGEVRTYVIHIYRTPSDDNTLLNIVIPNHTLTNPFQQYNTTYYVITSSKTTQSSLNIQPILAAPGKATYEIKYDRPQFETGSNLVRIVVTAENGEKMTYFIYVVLQNVDENYHLEYLNTDIYELMKPTDPDATKFNPTKFEYDFRVPMSESQICITARAESIQATVLGAQDLANPTAAEVCYDLSMGKNIIPVSVVAGNGVVKEYTLTVTRDGTAGISRIVAVPEKRIPNRANNNTWFLIEIVPAGEPYYKSDGSGTNVVWDNKADILAGTIYQTNTHGVWDAAELSVNPMEVTVGGGEYDVYFTGYSHLSKKKSSVTFVDDGMIEIEFTYDEDTLADMIANNSLSADDPMYPLRAGDAGVAIDRDLSCGPIISNCVTGGMFSGDEWGDDLVNSLDTSAVLAKLYQTGNNTQQNLTIISKEDLDGNGQINSLDMSITLNNLYIRGDK